MPHRLTWLSRRNLMATSLLLTLGLAGCPWAPRDRQLSPALNKLDAGPKSPDATPAKTTAEAAAAQSSTPLQQVLASPAWTRVPQSLHPDVSPAVRRWQHLALEELLSQPESLHSKLRSSLDDSDPVVAANAAIALARSGDGSVDRRLVAAIRVPTLGLPSRCAAVEALAGLDRPPRRDLLRELLGQYGRLDPESQSRYVPELHAELLHGLARHAEPSDQPLFLAALRTPSAEARLEALLALNNMTRGELPLEVADLRTDPDARVRAACMTALAKHPGDRVEEYLEGGLNDLDLRVHTTAIAAMGTLKTETARQRLRRLLNDPAELIRAAAVSALMSSGEKRAALEAAADKSWRVRLNVAQGLAAYPDRESAAAIQKFLTDPSAPVQQQAIEAMAEWPLERSGPILLEAMGKPVYTTRKASAELLARRWPPARQFSADAPTERRSEILNQLQQDFRQQVGLADANALAVRGTPPPTVSEETLTHVQLLVRRLADPALADNARDQAVAELKALGAGCVEALERVALDQNRPLPEPVYRDVLPACEPAFVALDRMTSHDVLVRRDAASDLAELAAKHPLRRLAVARLAELATTETDPLVWQSVLSAVATDGSEPALRLAAAAIGHPAAEVRLRACEHLAAHPDPDQVSLLMPALEDKNDEVAAAAARTLGLVGHLEDLGPLRQKLGARNQMVQLEAAVALARLGDESGIAALERLSYSGDEGVRRRTAAAMGEFPNPAFVPVLIRLLDDRQSVRVAALAALPKVAGQDVAAKPGQPQPRMAEHVELWKRWFQQRQ